MMEKENTSCANISVLVLRSCSQPFEHCSIQLDGTSGYTFYNKIDCQNQYIEKNYLLLTTLQQGLDILPCGTEIH